MNEVGLDEIKSFVATFLGAICIGWFSKLVALATNPIVTAATQYASGSGGLAVIIIVAYLIKQAYEDYVGYVAMGIFAVPAIVTFLLPWGSATILMGLSAIALAIMGKKVVFGWLGIESSE